MTRLARVVVPGLPHHVVQRGNRRQPVFFKAEDRLVYLDLLKTYGDKFGLAFWAYCLMENHIHLIAVPQEEDSLARAIGEAHRRYTRFINFREGWRGYLWQGRFSSYPLDEKYLYAAIRYIELNPVKAHLVKKAEEYPWSSAKAHVFGHRDPLLTDHFLKREIEDWSQFLSETDHDIDPLLFERHSGTGRPCGDDSFLDQLERKLGRPIKKRKTGPKPRN